MFVAARRLIQMRNNALKHYFDSSHPIESCNFFNNKIKSADDYSVIMLMNLDKLKDTIQDLSSSFPSHFLHTFAAKANPSRKILMEVNKHGMGIECASKGELLQALASKTKPEHIVFDSPAKTREEIEIALKNNVSLNIDNLQELDRVTDIINKLKYDYTKQNNKIGLRINPQIGQGSIKGFSTGTSTSKFGIAIDDYKTEITNHLVNIPWLEMLHCHVGSQGCDFSLMTSGIRKIVDLANNINKQVGYNKIKVLDIGGGLPVNFASDQILPTFSQYSNVLKEKIPELFDGSFNVITEFGRTICAKVGITIMQVEYTKQSGGKNFAVVQAGTDLFIRTIYHPDKWPLRVSLLDKDGNTIQNNGNTKLYDIAGPCCLGMDVVAFNRELPEINPNDHIILHDTGAYYHASFSYYNSRNPPILIGFTQSKDNIFQFELLNKIKTVDDTVDYFSY